MPVSSPKMLIISHSQLANYKLSFIKGSVLGGFDVYVINKSLRVILFRRSEILFWSLPAV
jgi:hypothetical protein